MINSLVLVTLVFDSGAIVTQQGPKNTLTYTGIKTIKLFYMCIRNIKNYWTVPVSDKQNNYFVNPIWGKSLTVTTGNLDTWQKPGAFFFFFFLIIFTNFSFKAQGSNVLLPTEHLRHSRHWHNIIWRKPWSDLVEHKQSYLQAVIWWAFSQRKRKKMCQMMTEFMLYPLNPKNDQHIISP